MVKMLWNWYTIDDCFLSSTWHISSPGMFAGSCIGVIALVISLEFLRRLQREHSRHIARGLRQSSAGHAESRDHAANVYERRSENRKNDSSPTSEASELRENFLLANRAVRNHPGINQHTVQATLYTTQFAVAYIIMLLAMYYNGYFIICIFIGAFIGHFVFSWDLTKR
ncbi:MAG: hypothetical protein Q9217_001641 [Psora testacea]